MDHRIVIAVDGSKNARRAVVYVGRLLRGLPGFVVTLLHVMQEADMDCFATPGEREDKMKVERRRIRSFLKDYQGILVAEGFRPAAVDKRIVEKNGPSLAMLIVGELSSLGAGTVVVGRQGLSRKEEFLFGSVSRQIVSHAGKCPVWVVH